MFLTDHKTKIVCTIGPATDTQEQMILMIEAGMNIARLNYSHGDFEYHAQNIRKLRLASEQCQKPLSILADLPGPKMRIGKIGSESIQLVQGSEFIISTEDFIGNHDRVSVSLKELHEVLKTGDLLFLNDGLIQLRVKRIESREIYCEVLVGGELRSYKGLNLPGIDLGILAFTAHDKECLIHACENGVDAVSQSFVSNQEDIIQLRQFAENHGFEPFIVAKIERAGALNKLDEILSVSDGIMIARGDLGVEIPIDQIAVVQKQIMQKANLLGKPVITATQMMTSMVSNPRPTRAEVTDVSNAILDGTDCIMLSEESAMGKYPVETVKMLSQIAYTVEKSRNDTKQYRRTEQYLRKDSSLLSDSISISVQQTVQSLSSSAVFAHTVTGHIVRMISRFKIPVWIVSVTENMKVYRSLNFTYGAYPILVAQEPQQWDELIKHHLDMVGIGCGTVLLVDVPSKERPHAHHKIEIIDVKNLYSI